MSISIILPIIVALILLRVFWLRLKASNAHNENFKQLPPKDQLAVLKECLLNSPAEINLQNLRFFLEKNGINQEIDSYRPFIRQQQELRNKKNALEEDNLLFNLEAQWLDQIAPLEFKEAEIAKQNGNNEGFITSSLEGINRLYSDESILSHLAQLAETYPKATRLTQMYRNLMELRDCSEADNDSLESLRKAKNAWEQDLLNYEP